MEQKKGTVRRSEETRLKSDPIERTLYDVIGAVQEVLPQEEGQMVTWVVCNLLNRTPARFQNVSWGHDRIVV